ncbi:MAG: cbb3-type cytochrome oxidase assembly protein CcoS [Bacteroidota bacterium]
MNMIFFLIGCSILLALVFLAAFFWAMRSGQNDDTYTPSVRMLFDDEVIATTKKIGDEDHT